jgi:ABC-type nitrate/sulfonate/bicarbonate transport system substrate-binding protein
LATAGGLAIAATGGASALSLLERSTAFASAPTAVKDLGTLDFQLSWIKNVEFAGEYIADTKGYYKKVGFSGANLISGGPGVAQDAAVAAGKAMVGISAPDITGAAIAQGAPLVIIGAQYQKNPFAIMSLADKPIKTPKQMIGKKIGVQATNEPVWAAFLKANKIDAGKIDKVTVQFDTTPLVAGEVDGWFSFITNEPNELKAKGVDTYAFLLNDFKYPLVSEIFMVRKDTLASNRAKVEALLTAEIMGWRDAIKDPALGANLTVTKYGKDLNLKEDEQLLEAKAENDLILTPDTKVNGIFTITPEQQAANISTLKLGGLTLTKKIFDMSVLKDVYAKNPKLKKSPV